MNHTNETNMMKLKKSIDISELTPPVATHPGEILEDELQARGLKQKEFAIQIGMQKSQLNEIINGKRSVNAEVATLLEASLNISAGYWLNAQNNYELTLVKIQNKIKERTQAIIAWNQIKGEIPVAYLKSKSCGPVTRSQTLKP